MTKQERAIAFVLLTLLGTGAIFGSLVTIWHFGRQAPKAIAPSGQLRVNKVTPAPEKTDGPDDPFIAVFMDMWTHETAKGEVFEDVMRSHLERTGVPPEQLDEACRYVRDVSKQDFAGTLPEGTLIPLVVKNDLDESDLVARKCPRDDRRRIEVLRLDIESRSNSETSDAENSDVGDWGPASELIRADVFRAYHQVQPGDNSWGLVRTHCDDVNRSQWFWASNQIQSANGIVDPKRIPIGTKLAYYEVPWRQRPKSSPKHCAHDTFYRVHVVNGKEILLQPLE